MEGYRFVDSDAHIFEPENIWDNYLESKYRSEISSFVNYKRRSEAGSAGFFSLKETEKSVAEEGADPLTFGIKVVVGGHTMPFGVEGVTDRVSLPGLGGAYEAYAEEGFPARAYREIMDNSGIDYMIVYPTVGLLATAVPDMSAELGTAIRRAYNTWLGDFCSEAGGRVFGAASIDLRDPEAAAKEVRRCVKEMGFKGVHFNPTPVGDYSLYDEACDPLWAEISDLDVPVGGPSSGRERRRYNDLPLPSGPYADPGKYGLCFRQHDRVRILYHGRGPRASSEATSRLPRVWRGLGRLLAGPYGIRDEWRFPGP